MLIFMSASTWTLDIPLERAVSSNESKTSLHIYLYLLFGEYMHINNHFSFLMYISSTKDSMGLHTRSCKSHRLRWGRSEYARIPPPWQFRSDLWSLKSFMWNWAFVKEESILVSDINKTSQPLSVYSRYISLMSRTVLTGVYMARYKVAALMPVFDIPMPAQSRPFIRSSHINLHAISNQCTRNRHLHAISKNVILEYMLWIKFKCTSSEIALGEYHRTPLMISQHSLR